MKRALSLIILAAVLVSLGILGVRWRLEAENRTVELVYDFADLQRLAKRQGYSLAELFAELGEYGVNTVAIQPENLGETLLAGKPLEQEVMQYLPEQTQDLAKFLLLPIAFNQAELEAVLASNLAVAPKLNTVPWEVEPIWASAQPDLLILSGQGQLREEQLADSGGRLALVEFSEPGLPAAAVDRIVRLHGISGPEMRTLPGARILNRYVRAVKERNIRVLYIRPFVAGEGSWERSINLLAQLVDALTESGFTIGPAEPFPLWEPAPLWTLLIGAGIWSAAVLYGQYLFPQLRITVLLGGILGWFGTFILTFQALDLAKQGIALLGALVFPPLAIALAPGSTPGRKYWGIAGFTSLGAILTAASLSGTEYMLKIQAFRGVKIAHVLPIVFVTFTIIRPLGAWLKKTVPIRYLVWAGCLGLAGVFYLLRTGNFGIPVPAWEIQAREFLENLLGARPRTKEFLIGHPALYLALQQKKSEKSWLLPLGVIGQISLLNTFTHLHTPLAISLLRTFYGLIFGYLMGWLVLQIIAKGRRWLESGSSSRLLRLWQSR